MSHLNITTGLGVMIGRCSIDSQHGRPDSHPVNVGCALFRYLNNDISNQNDQRPKHGREKTINLYYTAILRATLHREVIGKE